MARRIPRRRFLKGAAALGLLGGAGGGVLPACRAGTEFPPPRPQGMDAVQHHAMYQLRRFTSWLARFGERGYIGEVNWPNGLNRDFPDDQEKWNALGEQWYTEADEAGLWVTAWGVDERQLYGGFWLSVYRSAGEPAKDGEYPRAVSVAEDQAQVIEKHPSARTYRRGVNVSAADGWMRPEAAQAGATPNSNLSPGVHGEDYWYPGLSPDPQTGLNTFEYLYERGVDVVRLPFRWERLQSTPGGPLDRRNLAELEDSVAAAGQAGLEVVLDLHNFGGYWMEVGGTVKKLKLGSDDLTAAHFEDIWSRLCRNFRDDPVVIGYDLMNEPSGQGGVERGDHSNEERAWEALARAAADAIRGLGDEKWLIIPGYGGAGTWPEKHPEPWVSDDRHIYTAHQYFDSYRGSGTGGGKYRASYAEENDTFAARGW